MIDCKKTIDTLREVAAEVIVARITGRLKDEALQSAHGWLIAASIMLEEVARERDAAVRDLRVHDSCAVCKHYDCRINDSPCRECLDGKKPWEMWKWRGPCAANGGANDDNK